MDMDPLSWESDCATWDDSDNRQYTGALTWDLNENHGLQITFGRHDVSNSEATDWITHGAEIRFRDYEGDASMVEVLLNCALAGGTIEPATYEINAIEPEKVISAEVGMRTNWLEDRLRLMACSEVVPCEN